MRRLTPFYEEHVKMFAPLGFVPGLTPEQVAAVAQRGGWDAAGVPTRRAFHEARRRGSPARRTTSSASEGLEEKYPGMEHINFGRR